MQISLWQKIPFFRVISKYDLNDFRADLFAGLTVGIISFPMSIAFAILSGVNPVWGVYTSIITGIVAAIFGGSEHNITGPTSAMALVLAGIVAMYGENSAMTLALIMGIYQICFSLFRLGSLVNFVPYPVLTGFGTGVAVIIFFSQLGKFLGLEIGRAENVLVFGEEIFLHLGSFKMEALAIGLLSIIVIVVLRKFNKNIPGALFAIILATWLTYFFDLDIATIGSFKAGLPSFNLDAFNWELIKELLAPAGALALLASVESISTAAIAEKITKKKFDSNLELFGQGVANLTISFFKGIPSTGSFSRTAANIRSHASTRMAAIIHGFVILLILMFLGQFGTFIPMPALAGILIVVAYKMLEFKHIHLILRTKKSDALIFLVTFFVTLAVDLITAIEVGVIISILFIVRQISESDLQLVNLHDQTNDEEGEYKLCPQIMLLEIDHPLFFAAASDFAHKLNKILNDDVRVLILRIKHVDFIDTTGITILEDIVESIEKKGGTVIFSRMQKKVYNTLKRAKIKSLLDEKHHANRTRQAIKMAMDYIDIRICEGTCKGRAFKECPEKEDS